MDENGNSMADKKKKTLIKIILLFCLIAIFVCEQCVDTRADVLSTHTVQIN